MLAFQEESVTGKIVLSEPEDLLHSCKRIPSYNADSKRPNVFVCPMQDDVEI